MQTHDDSNHRNFREEFAMAEESAIREIKIKASAMVAAGTQSKIAGGFDGEEPLAEAALNGVYVCKMPDDPLSVLRISIGRSEKVKQSSYCVFRGDRLKCIDLLRRTLRALERLDA